MLTLTLRLATEVDSDFAYEVKRGALGAYVEQVWGWDEEAQRQLHERRFRQQDVRIINCDGTDVGIMSVTVATDAVHVHQLFLLPPYQSRSIGTQCMRWAMAEARTQGLPVRLQVMKLNPRARAFYQRLGFALIGETQTHELMEWVPDETEGCAALRRGPWIGSLARGGGG